MTFTYRVDSLRPDYMDEDFFSYVSDLKRGPKLIKGSKETAAFDSFIADVKHCANRVGGKEETNITHHLSRYSQIFDKIK